MQCATGSLSSKYDQPVARDGGKENTKVSKSPQVDAMESKWFTQRM